MSVVNILLLGTCDTKLEELLYLRSKIRSHPNTEVTLLDVGRFSVDHEDINITQRRLLDSYGKPQDTKLLDLARGDVVKHLSGAATACLKDLYNNPSSPSLASLFSSQLRPEAYHGIISAGGSGGTSLVSAAMRDALPVGFPKLIVSTVASGDTGPVIGETDITLMYSVVDIAGLNSLLQQILANAAGAIVGMANAYKRQMEERTQDKQQNMANSKKKRLGITMFGVTTPCVDHIRSYLSTHYPSLFEPYVFHATGHGGVAMERLIRESRLDCIIDLTTTEICDHLAGGVMSAGPHRLEAALQAGIPNIISLGATDMVNFGPRMTVPERYKERKLFEHNPTVTLMRTNKEECSEVGKFMARKISEFAKARQNVKVLIPEGGVSVISTPGAAFEDHEADVALIEALEEGLKGSEVQIVKEQRAINDTEFAERAVECLVEVMRLNEAG